MSTRIFTLVLCAISLLCASPIAQSVDLAPPKFRVPYGANKGTFEELNGIKLYTEEYGKGQPMLQIHGNGESIASMGHQIRFFADR